MLLAQFSAKLTIKLKNKVIISTCRGKIGCLKVRGPGSNGPSGPPFDGPENSKNVYGGMVHAFYENRKERWSSFIGNGLR